jgi:hypothetical protein
MLNVNAICEFSKSNPGKMLQVNVGGFLYGLTGIENNAANDAVVYGTKPVARDSKPSSGGQDQNIIGANPSAEKVRAAIESVTKENVDVLVTAVMKAMQ